ncbi:MAG: hypothetical protein HY282_16545 [Nitrospirae bacterium]|nr:hypothetical protein [Candidatus Manganitrophaceae bacterium]
MPRLIFIFLLLTAITFLLGRISGNFWHRRAAGKSKPAGSSDTLVQDPHCLTYVSRTAAQAVRRDGVTHYFCGPACAAAFEKKQAEKDPASR